MKRLALLSVTALTLAACSPTASDTEARYVLTLSGVEGERAEQTVDAAERVVERVVQSMGQEIRSKDMTEDAGTYTLHIELQDMQAAPVLTDILTSGFRFRLLREVPAANADVKAQLPSGEIGFAETGITEDSLTWVDVQSVTTTDAQGKSSQMGQVTIELTTEGKELFKRVQQENNNKTLGIYVRDRLVSTMRVAPGQTSEAIVISNVPSVEVANVFADDVNVGLHVTFQPEGAALAPAAGTGAVTATGSTENAASAASSR